MDISNHNDYEVIKKIILIHEYDSMYGDIIDDGLHISEYMELIPSYRDCYTSVNWNSYDEEFYGHIIPDYRHGKLLPHSASLQYTSKTFDGFIEEFHKSVDRFLDEPLVISADLPIIRRLGEIQDADLHGLTYRSHVVRIKEWDEIIPPYKGFHSSIHTGDIKPIGISKIRIIFYGRIVGYSNNEDGTLTNLGRIMGGTLPDNLIYSGFTVSELKENFHKTVDKYIEKLIKERK